MAGPTYIDAAELVRLRGDVFPCLDCADEADRRKAAGEPSSGAAVLGPGYELHGADLVSGRTLCGLTADAMLWIVSARPRALPS